MITGQVKKGDVIIIKDGIPWKDAWDNSTVVAVDMYANGDMHKMVRPDGREGGIYTREIKEIVYTPTTNSKTQEIEHVLKLTNEGHYVWGSAFGNAGLVTNHLYMIEPGHKECFLQLMAIVDEETLQAILKEDFQCVYRW